MAKTATATATKTSDDATKAPRGKKGEGPVIVSYLDREGKEAKRVSETTAAIRVATRDGKHVDYVIDSLSPVIRNQLVAMALAKRLDTFVRNGVNGDASNVFDLGNQVYDGLKAGVVYSRKEGTAGGAGRPFDFAFWKNIMSETARLKKQAVSEKQLDSFEMKLKSQTPAERKELIAKLKNDKVFMLAWKKAESAKLADGIKKGDAGDVDALDMF